MPVEVDQFRRLQGDIHRRAAGASEGYLPGGRLRLHQARRGTGSDQRDLSALLRVAQTKSNQEPLGHAPGTVSISRRTMKRLRKHIITAITIITAAFLLAAALTVGAQSTNVSGNWKLAFETPNGAANPSLVLKQEGEKLTGTYKGRFGESPLEGA